MLEVTTQLNKQDADSNYYESGPITTTEPQRRILGYPFSVFVYFAAYLRKELPDKIDVFDHVPMLFSNQYPLEGQFSATRCSGHDNAAT